MRDLTQELEAMTNSFISLSQKVNSLIAEMQISDEQRLIRDIDHLVVHFMDAPYITHELIVGKLLNYLGTHTEWHITYAYFSRKFQLRTISHIERYTISELYKLIDRVIELKADSLKQIAEAEKVNATKIEANQQNSLTDDLGGRITAYLRNLNMLYSNIPNWCFDLTQYCNEPNTFKLYISLRNRETRDIVKIKITDLVFECCVYLSTDNTVTTKHSNLDEMFKHIDTMLSSKEMQSLIPKAI